MTEDLGERFLQANANKEFICAEFTDVLRNLIRAVAMESEPSIAIHRATEQMGFVADLLERTEDVVTYKNLFTRAVEDLREIEARTDKEALLTSAALSGMSFIAEYTSDDSASRARLSRRRREFMEAIKYVSEERRRSMKRL